MSVAEPPTRRCPRAIFTHLKILSKDRMCVVPDGHLSVCGKASGLRKAAMRSVRLSPRLQPCISPGTRIALTGDTPPPCNRNLQAGVFWKARRSRFLESQSRIFKAVRNKRNEKQVFLSQSQNPLSVPFQRDLEQVFLWLLIC